MLSPADETPVEPIDAYTEIMDVALAVERVTNVLDVDVKRVSHEWSGLPRCEKLLSIGYDIQAISPLRFKPHSS